MEELSQQPAEPRTIIETTLPADQLLSDLITQTRIAVAGYSPEQVRETADRKYPDGQLTLDDVVEHCMIAAARTRLADQDREANAPKLSKYDEAALERAAAKRVRKAGNIRKAFPHGI